MRGFTANELKPDSGILDGLSDAQKDTLSYNALRIGRSDNTGDDSLDLWLVSYQAYAKLVEDYPSAGNDLQVKKVA